MGFVWIQLPVLLADCPASIPGSIEGKPYLDPFLALKKYNQVCQRLLSQMLKSVFLKYPEDGDRLVSRLRAAPEMVSFCRVRLLEVPETSQLTLQGFSFMQILRDTRRLRTENIQLDLV